MSAGALIDATSNVSSDEEVYDHLKNLDGPPALGRLLQILIDHMADEVNASVTHPQLGMQFRVNGKGLGLIIRNAVKFMEAKDGE